MDNSHNGYYHINIPILIVSKETILNKFEYFNIDTQNIL